MTEGFLKPNAKTAFFKAILKNELYLNPNNFSFIKYIKLVAAIPLSWLNENTDHNQNQLYNFSSIKEKLKNQIGILGKSNKTAYNFVKNRSTT